MLYMFLSIRLLFLFVSHNELISGDTQIAEVDVE